MAMRPLGLISPRTVPVETHASVALVSCYGIGGYDWSDQAEDGPTNFALMAYSSTSSNSEEEVGTGSKQKDEIQLTVENFKNSSKNLSKLIDCQIIDKCKISLGYNVVPPPYNRNFLPLKPNFSGLEEFVNESIVTDPTLKKAAVETSEAKASADKPKVVRKNFSPPLIEDCILDSEDEAESKSKIEKKTVKPSFAKIKFIKSKEQVKSPRNTTIKQVEKPRCLVTILNTKDHLGKFDGKADEGFFVGYSLNSKAFRVFNNRTRIMEENLHIRFSENTPNIAKSTKACDDAESKSSQDDGFQPLSDNEKKVDEDPRQEIKCKDQEKEDNVNSTNNVNAVGTNRVNAVSANTNNKLPFNPEMPALEDINTFNFSSNYEDDDEEADMNNMDTTIQVSHVPTTIIHKDHPLDLVIGDMHSTTQTRNMSKNLKEHGFVTTIHQRTNYKDLQNCLFACFLSQKEPKKTLVDLPYGKRVIGTKWVFQNKKDERGIMIRDKARLVAQGHTQEEGIDHDEVFALVTRIEAIRLFLAYAFIKDFVMYQMDVKSTFLYGKIEEEVYICQPLGFEDPDFPDKVYKVEKALYGLDQAPKTWKSVRLIMKEGCVERVIWEGQLQALVDGKKILITESTVRRDLQLEDDEVVDCLPNAVIFEHLTLMRKRIFWKGYTLISNHDGTRSKDMGEGSANLTDPRHTPTIIQPSTSQPQKTKQHRKPRRKFTKLPQPSDPTEHVADETINKEMDDSLESAATTATSLDAEQDRADIDASEDIYLVNVHNDKDMFGVIDLDGDEVIVESVNVVEQDKQVVDDITLAKALIKIKSAKPKALKKLSKKDQSTLDEELAFKLQAEEEEERIAREKVQQIEEVNIVWDDVQAKIDADYELAQILQPEEQD
nr:hypothetical protein [Tanacetum cinerariifolium]